jgi:hypothetical protein
VPEREYIRDKNGVRLDIQGGMNTVLSPDLLPPGKYPFLSNVRRYLQGRTVSRAPLGANNLPSALASPITSFIRMNDTTPDGPGSGFCLIEGTKSGTLNLNSTQIVTGLDGNPLSCVTFRPNASPRPLAYIADNEAGGVTLTTTSAETGNPATYVGNGMMKVRSDGVVWHMGIAEPQTAPTVTFPGGGSGVAQITYRYVYRGADIGSPSNPSPESIEGTNSQFAPNESIPATDEATNYTFDATQYEFVSPQIRTKGGVAAGTLTNYITVFGMGFAIPAAVNIDGISVVLNWQGQNSGTGVLSTVSLFYLGGPLGNAKFPGIQNQSFASDTLQGGNADTWGATLTPDIINDPSFGFGVRITTQEVAGTTRSFINSMAVTIYYSVQNAVITPTPSTDPQVNKIDIYRMGGALPQFTYVGTSDNSATPYTDTLSDLAAVDNPLLEFTNFEPFPSIDMPQKGVVSVAAGAVAGTMDVTWTSGDTFNVRWLPGTDIVIAGVAYIFYNRPSSTTHLTVQLDTPLPSSTTNLVYEIQEPDLAAQPSPAIWGPTPDNGGSFMFGLDPLNTGDLLWTNGNNFDAASDANRLGVTSPSEPLQNGVITTELAVVFSTERFWLIYPNFTAVEVGIAEVSGTPWILIQSAATRGLYMRYAIDALGSRIAWRAKDCIAISDGGGPEKSITDDIYNLFPHEGFAPTPITIGGQTVFPPDDTKFAAQTIKVAPGYIFYNYQDTDGNPRTLCYDIEGKGWSVDVYNPTVNCHLWAAGPIDQLLTGCSDGTVRALQAGGSETGSSVFITKAENGGDVRAQKRVGDVFVKALANTGIPIGVGLYSSLVTIPVTGYSPTTLTGAGNLEQYLIDFTSGFADDLDDIAAVFTWSLGSTNIIDTWQPDWLPLPEYTQDRPTDWDNNGSSGNKLWQGLILEADTFNNVKAFSVEDDQGVLHAIQPNPVTLNGQTVKAFSFATPFQSHQVRIVSTDGVPWRHGPDGGWTIQWVAVPFPESAVTWITEMTSQGGEGWQHLGPVINVEYVSTAPITLAFPVDTGNGSIAPGTVTIPSSGGTQTKIKIQVAANKWKLLGYAATSTSNFNLFVEGLEAKIKSWGSMQEYRTVHGDGGQSAGGAQV